MNRKIKFRGWGIHVKRWIFGDLLTASEDGRAIQYYDEEDGWMCDNVNEKTVGQFTGFYARKGQEIYESDIITYLSHRMDGTGIIEQGKVEWRQEEGCYVFVNRFSTRDNRVMVTPLIRCKEITVIGNWFDNPELMEGGAK